MDILEKGCLADGRSYEVLRVITPDPEVPEDLVRYFIASFGFDTYRNAVNDLTYWRLYYREALAGNFAPEVIDYHYVLRVEGIYAGRIWFAYSTKTGHGNFGNVYTEPAFRRCGVMGILMKHCAQGIQSSGATQLCCCSGNKNAIRVYVRHGFKLIYGGEAGPLCWRREGTFQDAERKAFSGHEKCTVRPGFIGDQFECDKFLYFTAPVWSKRPHGTGLAAALSEYRIAFQEKFSGNGVVNVLTTPAGADCAYAFALKFFGSDVLDFRFHPEYPEHLPDLLQQTAAEYRKMFDAAPVCAAGVNETQKIEALRRAGFEEAGGLKDQYILFQAVKGISIN